MTRERRRPTPGSSKAAVFDALTHPRPYKAAWSEHAARTTIRGLAGTQFDPELVTAFEDLPAEMFGRAV